MKFSTNNSKLKVLPKEAFRKSQYEWVIASDQPFLEVENKFYKNLVVTLNSNMNDHLIKRDAFKNQLVHTFESQYNLKKKKIKVFFYIIFFLI